MKLRIGSKLILVGLAILIVPLAIMAFVVNVSAQNGISALVSAQLSTITTSMSSFADSKLQGDIRTCFTIAESTDIVEGLRLANAGSPAAPGALAAIDKHLAWLGESSQYKGRYQAICVIRPDGTICAASKPSFLGFQVADYDYFKASREGKTFISKTYISKSKDTSVAISVPINEAGGTVIGDCVLFIKTNAITDELSKFVIGKTGSVSIIDRDGLFILHSDKEVELKKNIKDFPQLAAIAQKALAGESGVQSYVDGRTPSICGFASIPSAGWTVLPHMPESEFLSTAIDIRRLILSVSVLACAFAAMLFYFFSKSISRPLRACVDYSSLLARGELGSGLDAKYLERGDEIGDLAKAFKEIVDSLRTVVSGIQASAQSVAQGSEEISAASENISSGATEQSASAEEISSSIEEMVATIKQNSDNASITEGIADKAVKDAERGSEAVTQAVDLMKDISDKISIIEEIARQTNLLALNAAIEAARAGESGKGFAVVASEVRKLAERSQKAAGEITSMSKTTMDQAESAGSIISTIVPDIRKTADLVREIASASREQSLGVDQVGKAMEQLDKVTQQNASGSEEMASMSEQLSDQAQQLATTVAFFSLGEAEKGGRSAGAPTEAGRSRALLPASAGEEQRNGL
jgi:methyl-accepting chemotaxis protein